MVMGNLPTNEEKRELKKQSKIALRRIRAVNPLRTRGGLFQSHGLVKIRGAIKDLAERATDEYRRAHGPAEIEGATEGREVLRPMPSKQRSALRDAAAHLLRSERASLADGPAVSGHGSVSQRTTSDVAAMAKRAKASRPTNSGDDFYNRIRASLLDHLGSDEAVDAWLDSTDTVFPTTPRDAIEAGQAEAVLKYLESLSGPNPPYA